MSSPIISVENLGKKYQLKHQRSPQRYVALRDVIGDGAKRLFGRNHNAAPNPPANSEEFWALKDVSFTVEQGEVIGIIGRNGAGKSTLLKILSRITEPTNGRVRLRGRVASLLEVGTGFHPELTGRENIFLNGAILGMGRAEIQHKFDEIVAFAEVEKFLDTPVKRYSSGMYVRLAFGVAAHLEPEVLVVDEVLAVGDAEFQKKCLGKMGDMSKGGRTVLFVSHNLAAVKSLTTRGIVLREGKMAFAGQTEAAIINYLQSTIESGCRSDRTWGRGVHTQIRAARLSDEDGNPINQYTPGKPLHIDVEFQTDGTRGMSIEVFLMDSLQSRVGMASLFQFHGQTLPSEPGDYRCRLTLEPMWLASGAYSLDIKTSVANVGWDHSVDNAVEFDVPFSNPLGYQFDMKQSMGYGNFALLTASPAKFDLLDCGSHEAMATAVMRSIM